MGGGGVYVLSTTRLVFLKNKIDSDRNGPNLLKIIIRPLKFIDRTTNCTSEASTFGGQ